MKRPPVAAALFVALAIAFSVGRFCGPTPQLAKDLKAARVELAAARDTLRSGIATWEAFQRGDTTSHQAEHALAVSDSIRSRPRHRPALPAAPAPDSTVSDSLRWALAENERLERDKENLVSDTLRLAEAADSATASALRYKAAHRGAVEAASVLYASAVLADGRLNQLLPKLEEAEKRAVQLERKAQGCRVLGMRCPVIGPGVIVGADLKPQPGIALIIPL